MEAAHLMLKNRPGENDQSPWVAPIDLCLCWSIHFSSPMAVYGLFQIPPEQIWIPF